METSYTYDAFISYRRKDGSGLANRLRRKLVDYQMPSGFEYNKRKLNIYIDTIYEHATEDFFRSNIQVALEQTRVLIVICTPSVYERLPNGELNWVCREIEYFRSLPQGSNIWIGIGKGTFEQPLPMNLEKSYPNIQRLDLRPLTRLFGWINEDELAKMVGPLKNIPPDKFPEFKRENFRLQQKKKRRLIIGSFIAVAIVASLAISAAVGWRLASVEANRQTAHRIATQAETIPFKEFDLSLLMAARSHSIAATRAASRGIAGILNKNRHLFRFFHCSNETRCNAVEFLGETGLMATVCGNQVNIYHIQSGLLFKRLSTETDSRVKYVESAGVLAIGGSKNLILFYPDGTVKTFPGHSSSINFLGYEGSALLSIDAEGMKRLWRFNAEGLTSDAWDDENTITASQSDKRTFELSQCDESKVMRYDIDTFFSKALSLVSFPAEDNSVIVATNTECKRLQGNTHNITEIDGCAVDNNIFIGSTGYIGRNRFGCILWDLNQVHPLLTKIPGLNHYEKFMAISRDGDLLLVSDDTKLWISDRTGARRPLPISAENVKDIRFSSKSDKIYFLDEQRTLYELLTRSENISRPVVVMQGVEHFLETAHDEIILIQKGRISRRSGKEFHDMGTSPFAQGETPHLTNTNWILSTTEDSLKGYNVLTNQRWKTKNSVVSDQVGIMASSNGTLVRAVRSYDYPPFQLYDISTGKKLREIENPYVTPSGLVIQLSKAILSTDDGETLIALLNFDSPSIVIWRKNGNTFEIVGAIDVPNTVDIFYSDRSNELFIQCSSGVYVMTLNTDLWSLTAERIANRKLAYQEIINFDLEH